MKKETFPLTAAQNLQLAPALEYAEPMISGIGACLMLQVELDFELLKNCIQMEVERYDCLRLRFTAPDENGQIRQYLADRDTRDISLADMRDKTMEEAREQMHGWSKVPFDRVEAPMCEFVMVALPEGYHGVYLRIDHLIADSCSIIMLAGDVIELYCHQIFGTPMPGGFCSFRDAALKDITLAEDPVRKAKDEAFWSKQIQMGEPIYTDIRGPGRLIESRKRHQNPKLRAADRQMTDISVGQFSFYLEPEPTSRLLNYCSTNGISMTNLLLMGLRTYLSMQNGGEKDIGVRNYVSRRSPRLAKLSGGTRVHCFPCRTILEPEMQFLEGIRAIQNLQNNIYRHANYDSGKVIQDTLDYYHAPPKTMYESVALTYQPLSIHFQNENLKNIPYQALWFTNGTEIQPIYLTVMHNTTDTGLEFYFRYQAADYQYTDIETLYYYLMKILFKALETPTITIQEILKRI